MPRIHLLVALCFVRALFASDVAQVYAQGRSQAIPPIPVPAEMIRLPVEETQHAVAAQFEQQIERHWGVEPATLRYSLEELEGLAISNSPALSEARSLIESARGRSWQAGLPPNPTVGYVGNEIGNDGSAGQHGAYFSRRYVRGGKLEWSRAVECREMRRLEREYDVTRQRVLTDVRSGFYAILGLQQRTELLEQFSETNRRATKIARQLFAAGDNTKSDVLLAEVEYEQTLTDLAALSADLEARWRELARFVGDPSLSPARLASSDLAVPELSWEDALAMIAQSPRLATVQAEIDRNRTALQRARVEPTPNLNTQFSVQYDFSTDGTFAGAQIGAVIPTLNRNQGEIYAANANVRAAMQKYEKLKLSLERDLADKFGLYQNAKKQLDRLEQKIVPKTEEVVQTTLNAYEAGELGMADVLNAQRSLLRAVLRQQEAALQLRLAFVSIEGFLLSGGLGE